MQILGTAIFLFNRCFRRSFGLLMTNNASLLKIPCPNRDLRSGFWAFGCFTDISNALLLVFVFFLGFKALQLGFHYKGLIRFFGDFRGNPSDLKNGFCSGIDVCGIFYSKILSCMVGISRFPKIPNSSALQTFEGNKELAGNNLGINESSQKEEEDEHHEDDDDDDDDDGDGDGDEEKDLEALKKALKIEREQKNAAFSELEKERISSASAANEAMAMILRLQNEKSSIEIEANQYRRLAEQKQQYDQEVIESLQWTIFNHESERSILENQLNLCRQKLKHYLKVDEGDQLAEFDQVLNCCRSTIEDDFADALVSSLDMDSSLM